ncbi:MAG: hypothetical protein AAFR59_09910 [Bacteroidota bacterium]
MEGNRHLDDFVRKKVHERQYVYDDAYWAETAAFLDANQKPKRTKRFLWFVLLLLGCAVSMASIWWYQQAPQPSPVPLASVFVEEAPTDPNCEEQTAFAEAATFSQHPASEKTLAQLSTPASHLSTSSSSASTQVPPSIYRGSDPDLPTTIDATPKNESSLKNSSQLISASESTNTPSLELQPLSRFWKSKLDAPIQAGSLDLTGQGFPRHRHHVGIKIGLQRAPDWAPNEAGVIPENVTPTLGLIYQYSLSQRFLLISGLQYWQRAGLALDTLIIQQTFEQGLNEDRFDLRPRRLHAVKVPLTLAMRLGRKSQLRVGGYLSRLIDVESQLIETTYQPSTGFLTKRSTAWGYRNGIRPWQYGFSASYAHYMGRGILAEFQMGWSWQDLTDDAYFRQDRKDRQLFIQLSFSKSLFSF